MSESLRCPKCNIPVPADAPAGLCPQCLVQAGFESLRAPASQPDPTVLSPASSGFEPPTVAELAGSFPQLEILELLGKGGMGAVYKARQRGLDRLVAVKILPPEISRDPAFTERFQREARALARLSHPHIVAVYDFGQTAGMCYIVMEFVDGANLRQAIQTGTLTPVEALAIVPQVCEALQFAHDEGIVHRDIKPENILIDKRGRVKIADFGLAKLLGPDARDHSLTATHQVMGTLRYMAHEQMQGSREVDHRADIYSLGVVFYELLTGELPMGKFAPPSKRVQVDVRLDEIVLRALEQQPEQRYQHASDVKADVESLSISRPAPKRDETNPLRSVAPAVINPPVVRDRPNYGLLAMGGVMLVLGLVLLACGLTNPRADVLLWVGLGIAIGSGGCFSAAWKEDQRLPNGLAPDPGMLALGGVMVLVGIVLFLFVASRNQFAPPSILVWIAIGLTMGGGGCFAAAWQREKDTRTTRTGPISVRDNISQGAADSASTTERSTNGVGERVDLEHLSQVVQTPDNRILAKGSAPYLIRTGL